ncbi:hypothetical protein L0244_07490, partial [bacterium]|nr:hypothetical protein [bacterium]
PLTVLLLRRPRSRAPELSERTLTVPDCLLRGTAFCFTLIGALSMLSYSDYFIALQKAGPQMQKAGRHGSHEPARLLLPFPSNKLAAIRCFPFIIACKPFAKAVTASQLTDHPKNKTMEFSMPYRFGFRCFARS